MTRAIFGGSILHAIKAHGGTCWSPYFKDATAELASQAVKLGLSVAIWGIDVAPEAKTACAMGAESITISDPAIAAVALGGSDAPLSGNLA